MTANEESPLHRPSGPWRDNSDEAKRRRRRRLRRVVFSTAVFVAVAAFGWWLIDPFQIPRGHIVTAYASFDPVQSTVTTFTPVDESEWHSIDRKHNLSEKPPFALTLTELRNQLQGIADTCSNNDSVIVTLYSHGIAKDGEAFFLSDHFQPSLEESTLISVREILVAVQAIPCRTKLVVIDGGQIYSDARLGAAVNEFPKRLTEAVEQTNDPHLCVLSSHSQGETSQFSHRMGQTVFGHFVQLAIQGEADHDENGSVDVDEIERYVASNTQSYVAQMTGGRTTQSPRLIRGKLDRRTRSAHVLTVPRLTTERFEPVQRRIGWGERFKDIAGASGAPSNGSEQQSGATGTDAKPVVEGADPLVAQSRRLATLVAEGWMLRDSLQSDSSHVADRPHMFRAFEQSLVGCEHVCRTGSMSEIQSARKHLQSMIGAWKASESGEASGTAEDKPFTLSGAKMGDDSTDTDQLAKSLRSSLESDSLSDWMKKHWTKDIENIYEFRIVRQLLNHGIADPNTISRVFSLREMAARAVLAGAEVSDADSLRIAAEQLLLEKTAENWSQEADEALAAAELAFRQSLEEAYLLKSANKAVVDATLAAQRYLDWYIRLGGQDSIWSPTSQQIATFMKHVTARADAFGKRAAGKMPRATLVGPQNRRLAQLTRQIESIVDEDLQRLLRADSKTEGREWLVEQFLATTVPSATMRAKLLEFAEAEYTQHADFESPPVYQGPRSNQKNDTARIARLHLQSLRLASLPSTSLRRRIDSTLRELQVADASLTIGELNKRIRQFQRNRREQVAPLIKESQGLDAASTRVAVCQLRRTLETLDSRDAAAFAQVSLANATERIAAADRFGSQWKRFRAYSKQETNDYEYLADAADHFLDRKKIIFPGESRVPTTDGIRIDGPSELLLTNSLENQFNVEIYSTDETPVWLVAEYDDSVLEVAADDARPIYGPDRFNTASVNRFKSVTTLPVTKRMGKSADFRLPLTIRRHSSNQRRARMILTAVTPTDTARRSVDVELPGAGSLGISVTGLPGSWTDENGIVSLHPMPNRQSVYHISLFNYESSPRHVGVELFALRNPNVKLPLATVSAAEANRFLDDLRFANIASIPRLVVSPGNSTRLQLPKVKTPKNGASSADRVSLDYGFVIVVTEHDLDQVSFHRVAVAPQRPRRYVTPTVTYDARLRELQIEVVPRENVVPATGIRVSAELEGIPLSDTAGKTSGLIKAANKPLVLDVRVPRGRTGGQRLLLHIDGYPRSFVYDISPIQRAGVISETVDQLAVAIEKPDDVLALNKANKTVLAELKVDAPLGAFGSPRDRLVIGLDRDRDRNLDGDPQITLRNDRFVHTALDATGPNGLLQLKTVVTDQVVELPIETTANYRADLIARLEVDGHTAFAKSPAAVYVDNSVPEITDVVLKHGRRVAQGKVFEVLVRGNDQQLSGIDRVEAAFDVEIVGEFTPEMKLANGVREEAVGWHLRIPTKDMELGRYDLLVRATDRAGNVSEYRRVPVVILDKNTKGLAGPFNTVKGKVAFGRLPATGFKVTLSPAPTKDSAASQKTAAVKTAKTDQSGVFRFAQVPVGTYEITSRGMLKNMNLSGAKEINVQPPPAEPVAVDLSVRLEN